MLKSNSICNFRTINQIKPNKGFYIEKRIERKPIKTEVVEEVVPDRRVLIRNPSDYTKSSVHNDSIESTVNNSDESDFEKYFGFKPGEKVDLKKQLNQLPKSRQLPKKIKKPNNLQIEHQIASKTYKNSKIKPPTVSTEKLHPILRNQITRTIHTNLSSQNIDFKTLGNAHLYQASADGETETSYSEKGGLPQFYKGGKIPRGMRRKEEKGEKKKVTQGSEQKFDEVKNFWEKHLDGGI
jgi:hypothetical protein